MGFKFVFLIIPWGHKIKRIRKHIACDAVFLNIVKRHHKITWQDCSHFILNRKPMQMGCKTETRTDNNREVQYKHLHWNSAANTIATGFRRLKKRNVIRTAYFNIDKANCRIQFWQCYVINETTRTAFVLAFYLYNTTKLQPKELAYFEGNLSAAIVLCSIRDINIHIMWSYYSLPS